MKKSIWIGLAIASLCGLLACGEGAEPTPEASNAPRDAFASTSSALYIPSGVSLFPAGQPIRVCWVTVTLPGEQLLASDLKAAKDAFRLELKNSWERWANISFTGFNECPTSGSDRYVRIQIYWQPTFDSGGGCHLGYGAYQLPGPITHTGENSDLSCGVGPDRRFNDNHLDTATKAAIRARWQYIAVHEMGHVLGFGHEQDRKAGYCNVINATPGNTLTALDRDSVMNYCGSHGNARGVLTGDDIRGVIAAYGRRPGPGPSMFYNGFEGTQADAWSFNGGGGIDRNFTFSRSGANNGWVQGRNSWNAANVAVWTGGAGHRCDLEVLTRLQTLTAQNTFTVQGSAGGTGTFTQLPSTDLIYQPVKFSFDAASLWQNFNAGFQAGSTIHTIHLDDLAVNCSTNLTGVTFDSYWQTGTSFLVSADHLSAGGAAHVRYQNVPAPGGGFREINGNLLTPDANHKLVYARDMALSTAGLTCTTEQLNSFIYATIVDAAGVDSKVLPISARYLCYNG